MKILRYPFQAFFQPAEMEDYLGKNVAIRKRVVWTHVAIAAGWLAVCLAVGLLMVGAPEVSEVLAGLLFGFLVYAVTIIVGLACGGLSKRDNLLTFVISTYWWIIVSLAGVSILVGLYAAAKRGKSIGTAMSNAAIFMGLIIIASIVVNLHGKTRGIKPAIILALAGAIVMVIISMSDKPYPTIYAYREMAPGQRRLVDVEGYLPHLYFNGILPLTTTRRFITRLEQDGNSGAYTVKSLGESNYYGFSGLSTEAFTIDEKDLDKLKDLKLKDLKLKDFELKDLDDLNETSFPAWVLQGLKPLVGQTYSSSEFFAKLTLALGTSRFNDVIASNVTRAKGIFVDGKFFVDESYAEERFPLPSKSGNRDGSEVPLPNNESLHYLPTANGMYEVTRRGGQGETIWKVTLSSKPLFVTPTGYSQVIVKDDRLHLYADDRPYILDFASGKDLTAGQDFSWYPSKFGERSNPVVTSERVYSVSPSGYVFAPTFANGTVNISPQPLYANELRYFSRRILPFIFAFYLIVATLVLCVGLYRIPIYVVESVWQSLYVIKMGRKPAAFKPTVSRVPLFFDHISTLPLPFSSAFLARVAEKDERECADLLLYLLEKTQQKKLATRLAGPFFKSHPTLTFEWLYRLLKPEKSPVFELLNRRFKQQTRPTKLPELDSKQEEKALAEVAVQRELEPSMGLLFDVCQRLMSANPKRRVVPEVVEAVKPFAAQNYRHAREVLLTYEIFAKFYGFRNVQELADADLVLVPLQQISITDTLNVNLADIWGVVIELASDLKNYDVVESFRDKQYYLSEARIKLYEITRRAQRDLSDPEATVLVEIVETWQELIITEAKYLRGPAELQLAILNKQLSSNGEWNNILVTVKNVGQSPAENIAVALLENENVSVLENKKLVRLLGTGDVSNLEFAIMSKGNPSELRLFFDAAFDDFERKGKAFTFADVIRLTATVDEFKKIQNPYVVGIPLQSDKVFYGRRKVLDFALENLQAGQQNNVLIFYGQRRIGKSSLLYRIKDSPLKADYLFVYIDCQGFADADTAKLLYRICESIHFAAREQGLRLEAPLLDRFKQDTFIELDAFLNRSEEALGHRTLVLMLDEYEFLEYKVKEGSVSPEIFNKLRNLMQHRNKKMTFIFVGTHRLQELTSNYWSFLFNTALYYEIGALGEPEARALITDPVKGYLRYDDLAVDKILRITGMHPYFIQGSCRALVNYCNRRKKNYVTLTDVNEVMREAVESSTAHVKYLYQDYANETEQQVLTFLARVTDDSKLSSTAREISRFAIENGFQFEPGPVQEILAGLKNKRLVREDGEMHEQFGFEYEFLRIWIKEHIKIRNGALVTS